MRTLLKPIKYRPEGRMIYKSRSGERCPHGKLTAAETPGTTENVCTLCYAILLPGRKLAFRAGFWPDCYRENTKIGPPAGLRPAGEPISVLSRQQSGQNPARKADFWLGSTIA